MPRKFILPLANDNKIHYTTRNGIMYYDRMPVINAITNDFLTYEEFMLPKQTNTEGDLCELVGDVLDDEAELDRGLC